VRAAAVTVLAHALGILIVVFVVYICYRYGDVMLRKLGPTGVSVLTRLLAFILLCIGVQITWNGVHGFVAGAFPSSTHSRSIASAPGDRGAARPASSS
jgi:multiple antibiotic resistance protein